MRKQPHLPNPDDDGKIIDEKRIKMFLIMCKNSLERTKVKLDQHYTVKLSIPEYYSTWDPCLPEIVQSMKLSVFVPLPRPTHEGHRVCLYCVRTKDDDKFVCNDFMKLCQMSFDLRLAKLDTFKKDIYIFDSNNFSMNYVTAILRNIKKIVESSFMAYPMQLHEIHIINTKSFIQPLINVTLSLLKHKISGRVLIHKSIEELKNYIDPSVLPLNYGGTFSKTSEEIIDEWHNELIRHREWLITQTSIVADNSKRPKNSNDNSDSIENIIEGSFRKLDVD
ncbi:alpha-tocopherol transfer protein-like isoform X3 [Adelges cooleyi]|uniref:alpha-tocopherol transfer protein-like isoform X2 n=1 Tax=Adelges cooleyi TaxID=133065 RepID=UPI00217F496C|nr:alpha-tocopherol transfer protein-like isoform X2 [Adelges cooleyi]XP_050444402.1 alpha-tocopherol transfer protein-like isoform X3 [Adelges cooleyi]